MISVCIATYNGEKYVKEQIESILDQLSVNDEIVISDDSSTDSTIQILRDFKDRRIKIFINNSKHPSFNFENALKNSHGDVIFLADQDDKWLDGKVEVMMSALEDADLVLSDSYVGDENLKIINDSFFKINESKKGWLKNITKNSYLGCCMAFKREILQKALPFPKHKNLLHDYWLGMIGETFYNTKLIPNKLLIYRRHSQNASTASDKSTNSVFQMIGIRSTLLLGLIQRIGK